MRLPAVLLEALLLQAHFAVYTALLIVTNITTRTWNWHCFIWNIRLQLNNYQLEIPLVRSNLHAGINVIVYLCIVCRCKWKIYNLNFFFFFLSCASETFSAVPQLSLSLHLSFYFCDPYWFCCLRLMSVVVYGSGFSVFFIIWDCSAVVNIETTFSVLSAYLVQRIYLLPVIKM